jgi:hypothetical protein
MLAEALRQHDEVEIVESNDSFGEGGYDLMTPEGTVAASLVQRESLLSRFLGNLTTRCYVLRDERGELAAELVRARALRGISAYEVLDPRATRLATITPLSAFRSGGLRIAGADGTELQLADEGRGSKQYQVRKGEAVLAGVQERDNGPVSSTQRYRISYATGAPVMTRFLIATAVICLDQIHDGD